MSLPGSASLFLFGPRGTGKSTWIGSALPSALRVDLLKESTFVELAGHADRLEALAIVLCRLPAGARLVALRRPPAIPFPRYRRRPPRCGIERAWRAPWLRGVGHLCRHSHRPTPPRRLRGAIPMGIDRRTTKKSGPLLLGPPKIRPLLRSRTDSPSRDPRRIRRHDDARTVLGR